MAQTGRTLELEQRATWAGAEQEEEARWPVYKTALFVVTSSIVLWGGLFALIGWLW